MEQPIESQEKNIQESNEISTNNNNNSSSKLIIDKNDLPKLKKTYYTIFRDIIKFALAVDVSTQAEALRKINDVKKEIEDKILTSKELQANVLPIELEECQCPLCGNFFKGNLISTHLIDCLNSYYLQSNHTKKRKHERLEGTEIEVNLKSECAFSCLPYSSKKRKSIAIELEDVSIKLCRFQHLKSPPTWIGICNTCEKRRPKNFNNTKTCSYLGHTQSTTGVMIKHFSKQKKKVKIEMPFCSYQCFMVWILSRQQKQWENACREGDISLLQIKGETYPTKSFATIKKEVSEMTSNVIHADQYIEEN